MSLLKKENWLTCLFLTILTEGIFNLILAQIMGLYDKKAWYCNYKYWLCAVLFLIFPVVIMFSVFQLQIMCKVADSLEVPGKEIYNNVFIWILLLIIPIIGWIIIIVLIIYLTLWPSIMLYNGNGEKYIK